MAVEQVARGTGGDDVSGTAPRSLRAAAGRAAGGAAGLVHSTTRVRMTWEVVAATLGSALGGFLCVIYEVVAGGSSPQRLAC